MRARGRTRKSRPRRERSGAGTSKSGSVLDGLGAGGYVQDGEGGSGELDTRGGRSAPTVSIGGVGSKIEIPDGPTSVDLPTESDLTVPPPDVESLDARTIQKVVSSKRASVRLCYEKSLKAKENLQGKLKVTLVVEPGGRVSKASIGSSSFRGSVVGNCILSSVRKWRFPRFAGSAQEIELPFVFQRGA